MAISFPHHSVLGRDQEFLVCMVEVLRPFLSYDVSGEKYVFLGCAKSASFIRRWATIPRYSRAMDEKIWLNNLLALSSYLYMKFWHQFQFVWFVVILRNLTSAICVKKMMKGPRCITKIFHIHAGDGKRSSLKAQTTWLSLDKGIFYHREE